MKAILMAAGYGGRISQFTNEPKSLLKLNNETIIRHTVEMLLKNNISVTIIVGFKNKLIEKELEDLPVKFYYNPFYKVTNSIASLWLAKEELETDEDIILGNADVYWEENLLYELLNSEKKITILGDRSRRLIGDYFFGCKNNIIQKYGKELLPEERTCEYVGLAKVKASFLPTFKSQVQYLIEDGQYNLWWENALYTVSDKFPIFVKDVENKFWAEVDYIEDYERLKEYIKSKNKFNKSLYNEKNNKNIYKI